MKSESRHGDRRTSAQGPHVLYDTVANFEGWHGAPAAIEAVINRFGSKDVLEIGAGAHPTLSVDRVRTLGVRYTTNDISQDELDKADPAYIRLCHDLSGEEPPAPLCGSFDLVFSRMVNEHVSDGERYYRNIATMLRPGGISTHWFSTLYALPFLGNRLMPESLADRVLDVLAPRDRSNHGKFKAYYSWGRGPTRRMVKRLESVGFEVLEYTGYFGHTYYRRRMPVLDFIEGKKAQWLARHPHPLLTSYARVLLRKRA
jgi:SAM-dependent methyltransferase